MALCLFSSLVKNRKNFAKNILLNSKLVSNFKKDDVSPLSKTTLYYNYNGSKWEFTLNHARNTVATRLYEDEANNFRQIHVISKAPQIGFEKPVNEIWTVNSDAILFAEDISTTQSYVFVLAGNQVLRLKTSHVVADLSRAYSTSVSLSQS